MSDERLTCLVPTHNRPQFLRRLLRFYSRFSPGFKFLVVDSSHPAAAAENVAVIESWKSDVEVEYRYFDLSFIDKCVRGLEQVRTPFVVFCGDDDILFPDAVRQCVEFLASETGYSSALGRTVQLNTTPAFWDGSGLRVLKGYSIEQDGPLERCRQMVTRVFSSFYAVYRTETLLGNFRITAGHTDSQQSLEVPEALLSQLSVLRGRLKVLPLMYSIRQRHRTNASVALRSGLRPQVELFYQRFKECLTDQFQHAGIDRADAQRFIDDSLGFLRDPNLAHRRPRRSPIELARQVVVGLAERAADLIWTNCARHCRPLRPSDFAGCKPEWHAALQLIRGFPQGMPSDHSALERCA